MTLVQQQTGSTTSRRGTSRWLQLVIGIVCMVMVANLQYGWTLFVGPMQTRFGWERGAIQVAFTIFVLAETWLVPIEGLLVDHIGPRPVVMVGGLLVGVSWVLNSFADSLTLLYVAQAIGGIGAGAVYGTCVGNALKWFPDRRGLAAGLTAAGFGIGSALTVVPISSLIQSSGYSTAFLDFGLLQGVVIMLAALGLRRPLEDDISRHQQVERADQRIPSATPRQMLRSPIFWTMYAMFVLLAAGGLMATAQLAPIAKDFKIANVPVSLLGLTLPALTFALSLDRVLNGLTRPFFGWVSDHIGRENTMFLAFSLEAAGIFALNRFGQDPVLFVLLTGLVFFAWGEIYSLFPATCGDTFGPTYATTNAGLLYTAKGTAALLVPLANVLTVATGDWHAVFIIAAVMNAVAAVMALLLLKPMRRARVKAFKMSEVLNVE
jgi:OFA family oxalate/formate antiporter-like MFS transporter